MVGATMGNVATNRECTAPLLLEALVRRVPFPAVSTQQAGQHQQLEERSGSDGHKSDH